MRGLRCVWSGRHWPNRRQSIFHRQTDRQVGCSFSSCKPRCGRTRNPFIFIDQNLPLFKEITKSIGGSYPQSLSAEVLTTDCGIGTFVCTVVHRLTTGIRSEKCVIRRFRRCANAIGYFKQINQLDATISQVYYLTFVYSSTCFGGSHAHHKELNNCSSSLWLPARPRPAAFLSPRSNGKTRGCYFS